MLYFILHKLCEINNLIHKLIKKNHLGTFNRHQTSDESRHEPRLSRLFVRFYNRIDSSSHTRFSRYRDDLDSSISSLTKLTVQVIRDFHGTATISVHLFPALDRYKGAHKCFGLSADEYDIQLQRAYINIHCTYSYPHYKYLSNTYIYTTY